MLFVFQLIKTIICLENNLIHERAVSKLKRYTKLIPYIEIIAGVIFLCLEIHDYRTLYSMAEADAMYGGLADFCKYKENVFCPAFFWIIVILTGLSYWKIKDILDFNAGIGVYGLF